jgi:hypothetical protein
MMLVDPVSDIVPSWSGVRVRGGPYIGVQKRQSGAVIGMAKLALDTMTQAGFDAS